MLSAIIIGAGAIADIHAKAYLSLRERVRIVAVAEPDAERAKALAERRSLSASTRLYADFAQALAAEKPDIASVCTPPSTHADIACACLDAGVNVLLEKPMASSLEECDRILAAADRGGALLSVVAQSRFITPTYNLKRLLDDGICGRRLFTEAFSLWWRDARYHDLDYRGRWSTEGGGCTLGHAVHHVDLLLWLAGMPAEVTAVIANLAHTNSEMEDLSMAFFRFADSALGSLTTSLIHHGEPQLMRVQTEKAGLSIPFDVRASRSLPNGFPEPDGEFAAAVRAKFDSFPALAHEGHAGQIADFIGALNSGGQPLVTGQSGRNAIEVIMAIYKSSVTRAPVTLPVAKDDPFYTKAGMVAAMPHFFEKTKSVARFDGASGISLAGDRMK